MKVFVFPGQGSQKKGMGADLFDRYPELVKEADEVLGYSLRELCLEDPNGQLSQTEYTQPALFAVSAMMFLERGEKADLYLGHSLGEYTALFAAGVFDFGTGLKLVQKRGALMSEASGGGMAAVLGLSLAQVQSVLKDDRVQVANVNAPSQVVISGEADAIVELEAAMKEAGARKYVQLSVSGAFHSKFMEAAQKQFRDFLEPFSFSEPKVPVISNAQKKPYELAHAKDWLAEQICAPVCWTEMMEALFQKDSELELAEIGPGKVLSGLNKQIKKALLEI